MYDRFNEPAEFSAQLAVLIEAIRADFYCLLDISDRHILPTGCLKVVNNIVHSWRLKKFPAAYSRYPKFAEVIGK
jgi:hypothetical protein